MERITEGTEPNVRFLSRKRRETPFGLPRSFALQRTLAQDDKSSIYRTRFGDIRRRLQWPAGCQEGQRINDSDYGESRGQIVLCDHSDHQAQHDLQCCPGAVKGV